MKQFQDYSAYYDKIYKGKSYRQEAGFIDNVINKYNKGKDKRILSLGCGTLNHEILLSNKGYSIIGLDKSKSMVKIGKQKLKEKDIKSIKIFKKNIKAFKLNQKFNIVMSIFNVFGYQTTNSRVDGFLKSAFNHLNPDGLLLFDCWYAPAVYYDKPTDRIKEVSENGRTVLRITNQRLDIKKSIIQITFRIIDIHKRKIDADFTEMHKMRFWSYQELKYLLENHGFTMEHTCEFMDLHKPISEKTWNIFVIARKTYAKNRSK